MKRTISILLAITVLLSVFILPISANAYENFDEVDTKNAIAVNANSTQYKDSDLSFSSDDPIRTYKITAEEAGVYRIYADSLEAAGMKAYLFKSNNLNPMEYIKSSSLNKENRRGGFDITHYLSKGDTVYVKICYRYSSPAGRKFDFIIDKKNNLVAKNGCILEKMSDSCLIVDNYINKYQGVTLPNEVDNLPVVGVDERAFSGCKFITSLSVPSNCKVFNYYSFENCTNLKTIKLADGVQKLNACAFDGTQVESIYLPKTVDNVDALKSMMFLKSITVAKDSTNYTSENGILFSKDKKKLVRYPACGAKTYTIPNGVVTINSSAFSSSYIEKVNLPNTIKTIGTNAFKNCERLKYIKLNEGVTSIGTFQGCKNLSYINIPSTVKKIEICGLNDIAVRSVEIPENVQLVDDYSIYNCKYLDAIVFKGKNTEITTNAFRKMDVNTIYGPKGSTAEKYATNKGINFVSTTLEEGTKCTDHHYIQTECTKIPDCMNYGIFKTKCAICGKAGANKKTPALNHYRIDDVCKYCGISTTKFINADFNKSYSEVLPIPVSTSNMERTIIFNAPKDGKYSFNVSNLSDKVLLDVVLIKYNSVSTNYATEAVSKSFKKSLSLTKGDQLKIRIRGLNNNEEYYNTNTYQYYEPIKFNFKVTCDHIYKNTVVKPTYVSEGYTLHKCTTCGYSYKDKKTAKLKLQTPSNLKLNSGKKSLIVSYKKVTKATGYQIQYSLKSNFKSAKIIKINKNTTTKTTIKKLSSNKKYYVRVRSYVAQNKKTAYSSWSKSSNTKVK